jgi:hypothetical protein
MKNKIIITGGLAAVIAAGAVGCATKKTELAAQKPSPVFSHSRDITNPYLPLASLKQDILENKSERVERTARPGVHKVFQLGGQTFEALTVEDREYSPGGDLIEATLDYFAQDDDGNVYYLGEDVDTYKNGQVSGHSGTWLLGKDTQKPGVLMPAHPQVGNQFMSEDVPKITWEKDAVVSVNETVTVPAGTFSHCVKIKEIASDGDTEIKFYAPGVGCIEEIEGAAALPLKSHTTK